MKNLIIFIFLLVSFLGFYANAKTVEITVKDKATDTLLAGDKGDDSIVTLDSLKLKSGLDLDNTEKYLIDIVDIDLIEEQKKLDREKRKQEIAELKALVETIKDDVTVSANIKKVLVRLIKELKED